MIQNQLSLRRFRTSDHKEYRKARSASEIDVSAFFEIGPLTKTSKRRTSYEFIQQISGPDKNRHFAIFWNKILVGHFSLYEGSSLNSLQIVYWIRSGFTGLGIATWALSKISNNLFRFPQVHFLELFIDPNNHASIRVATKCGYSLRPPSQATEDTENGSESKFAWFVLEKGGSPSLSLSNPMALVSSFENYF
jgi:RimJ/RimL family protein N-acetyltransferase